MLGIDGRTPASSRALPTIGPEVGRILAHDAPASAYAGIRARTLLATGSRSSRSFGQTCDALAEVIADAQRIVIPRAMHNTANAAPPALVEPLVRFFEVDDVPRT